jgi:hypothetical protein
VVVLQTTKFNQHKKEVLMFAAIIFIAILFNTLGYMTGKNEKWGE